MLKLQKKKAKKTSFCAEKSDVGDDNGTVYRNPRSKAAATGKSIYTNAAERFSKTSPYMLFSSLLLS